MDEHLDAIAEQGYTVLHDVIPPDVVAVGNPCRVVRDITEQDRADYLAAYGAASS